MTNSPPKICVAITRNDMRAIASVEPFVDLFEVRIDLIGTGWKKLVNGLKKPWIACNRRPEEGGKWQDGETKRLEELMAALELGASIVDIELGTPGVEEVVKNIKGRAEILVSYHNLKETPELDKIRQIIINQLAVGADICKVVTAARSFQDNLTIFKLISLFPSNNIIAFCMGEEGRISRILSPLMGGYFTYASVSQGKESAAGQVPANVLRDIYQTLRRGS